MANKIKLTLQHEEFPDMVGPRTVETFVDVEGAFPDDLDGLIECVREEYLHGLKSAAGGHVVDYDAFTSDSAYLEEIDLVVRNVVVVDVAVPGAKAEEQFTALWKAVQADPELGKDDGSYGLRTQPKPAETGPDKFEETLDRMQEVELDEIPVQAGPTP